MEAVNKNKYIYLQNASQVFAVLGLAPSDLCILHVVRYTLAVVLNHFTSFLGELFSNSLRHSVYLI